MDHSSVSPSHQRASSGEGETNIKESQFHNKKKQMLKARSLGKKIKSRAEIEAIDNQRRLQRDANKAELA